MEITINPPNPANKITLTPPSGGNPITIYAGIAGPTGPIGPVGPATTLSVGGTTTGIPGSSASVSLSGNAPSQTMYFTVPSGVKGDTGATGPSNTLSVGGTTTGAPGSSAIVSLTGSSPNQYLYTTIPSGLKGDTGSTGASPTLSVNSLVGSVAYGQQAKASLSGTATNPVLNLTLPSGQTGATGATGSTGATGASPTLSVNSAVASVPSGTQGSASLSGTATNPVLNLTLPVGATGQTGATGSTGATGATPTLTANSLVGSVPYGAQGTASITGSASNPVLNLTLPAGATGATGQQGPKGDVGSPSIELRVYNNELQWKGVYDPTLVRDFAGTKDLNIGIGPAITFSRGTAATYTDANGLVQFAPMNLLTYSQGFTVANWGVNPTPSSVTTTASAPDGTSTATQFTGAGGYDGYYQFFSTVSGTTYTYSVYAKYVSGSTGATFTFGRNNIVSVADLKNGTIVSNQTGATSTITNVGNGWYRLTQTWTEASGGAQAVINYTSGGVSSTIQIWGAQVEQGSTATTYNPTTTAPYYGPRFDHDPVTHESKGLLIEESRVNLLTYSGDLSQQINIDPRPDYTATVTANATTAPDGTNAGTKFVCAKSAYVTKSVNFASLTSYTGSVWLRADSNLNCNIVLQDSNGAYNSTTCNLTTTWKRFYVTYTPTQTGGGGFHFINNQTGSPFTVYVWGAQVELGTFATSYIPTAGAAVTRAADVAQITDLSFYNQTEGTFVTNCVNPQGTGTYSLSFLIAGDGLGAPAIYCQPPTGAVIVDLNNVVNVGNGSYSKQPILVATALKSGNYGLAVNGVLGSGSASSAVPATITNLQIGSTGSALRLNGCMKALSYYNRRLPDSMLQSLTQ